MQTPIFRTEEPLWFLKTAWCSQTQMGLSESTVWDLQSLMGARRMWTLGDAGMGPSEMPVHRGFGLFMNQLVEERLDTDSQIHGALVVEEPETEQRQGEVTHE
ncbi:hypothetical protein FJT64_021009 [Amphibalanus amphitrite]|uniref:Uncharacterized protein n=1 Tax=Amphibalanus amphitrite TaxID=1232801 RepID=A0A6A4WJW2_AMPAM|nr:hypothetical protein FJT64_021009 [Amphibalanus amphitrite]